MSVSREDLNLIVQEVLNKIGTSSSSFSPKATASSATRGIFDSVDDAVAAADRAQKQLVELPLKTRIQIIDNMRR
ncbi:MAG: aldehyde dehydrogenase EutE, partial [Candidatus Riflebacteria bacterium]|nr:aldehyde dehydrogenase EutE [Candidatus Riflebacteria bacterium]